MGKSASLALQRRRAGTGDRRGRRATFPNAYDERDAMELSREITDKLHELADMMVNQEAVEAELRDLATRLAGIVEPDGAEELNDGIVLSHLAVEENVTHAELIEELAARCGGPRGVKGAIRRLLAAQQIQRIKRRPATYRLVRAELRLRARERRRADESRGEYCCSARR